MCVPNFIRIDLIHIVKSYCKRARERENEREKERKIENTIIALKNYVLKYKTRIIT